MIDVSGGPSKCLPRFGATVLAVVALLAVLAFGPVSPALVGATGDDLILSPRRSAPTLPGAPFRPSATRENVVQARLSIRKQLAELTVAQEALEARSPSLTSPIAAFRGEGLALTDPVLPVPPSTARILDSQIASLERDLAELAELSEPLLDQTAPFNIAMAAFPVAELRKPFFNDWGRPRSGGRTHKGNDMLAQTGVDLRAIEDGYVEQTSNGSLGGLSVYLIGESGARYYYAHLDELADLEEGENVLAGQVVGTVGDSGNARGAPHLHMQWSPTGESNWENPFPLLDILFGEGAAAEALAEVDEVPSIDRSDDTFMFDGGS